MSNEEVSGIIGDVENYLEKQYDQQSEIQEGEEELPPSEELKGHLEGFSQRVTRISSAFFENNIDEYGLPMHPLMSHHRDDESYATRVLSRGAGANTEYETVLTCKPRENEFYSETYCSSQGNTQYSYSITTDINTEEGSSKTRLVASPAFTDQIMADCPNPEDLKDIQLFLQNNEDSAFEVVQEGDSMRIVLENAEGRSHVVQPNSRVYEYISEQLINVISGNMKPEKFGKIRNKVYSIMGKGNT